MKMLRLILLIVLSFACSRSMLEAQEPSSQQQRRSIYELRTYSFESDADHAQVDAYLKDALLPALKRNKIGPVGVFTELEPGESSQIYVLIPYSSIGQFAGLSGKLFQDEEYRAAARTYLNVGKDSPAYQRIESSLMRAFAGHPAIEVSEESDGRIFELRVYESHSEGYGNRKVHMFNNGEIDIFRDCGIKPVFFGQTIVGEAMPNLTYLTVYSDMEARDEAWKKFRAHPDWMELKEVKMYQDTVSNITKVMLKAKPYSQL